MAQNVKNAYCALELNNVVKTYGQGDFAVKALKGVSLNFRKNEFVSILGPSGCGKTTLLNIIGGLDRYTSGDLIIEGTSTKNYKDKDWDVYRNQRIGFIFQSYNLIPHQTVLGNVELALTISGVSKEERVKRSLRALERVGLAGEEHKRPNQLSGGQCQRVAIARALVNEPDILLADEPTGALDSKTSVQIMELIKDIAKDKLVIMVTHNGELAEEYSTRIINLRDGEIVDDSNPCLESERIAEKVNPTAKTHKKNKAKMSMWTAFKLSGRNLLSKFKRTLLTAIAGSIGIIGISAVLAVSSGVRGYIDTMQDDMLSGNPITVTETAYDLDAMMGGMTTTEKVEFLKEHGYVNVDSMLTFLAESMETMNNVIGTNDITQDYVDYVRAIPNEQATVLVDRGLNVANSIFADFTYSVKDEGTGNKNSVTENISLSSMKDIYTSVMKQTQFAESAYMITSLGQVFRQAPNDEDYIRSQYDIKSGKIATAKDEIMIVVNSDWALTDLTLAQLGYYTQDEFLNIAYRATEDEDRINQDLPEIKKFSDEELMARKFVWYDNDALFNTMEGPMATKIPFTYNYNSKNFAEGTSGMPLKVVGILSPKENLNYGCLQAGFYYTEAFSDYVVEKNANSAIAKYIENEKDQVFKTSILIDPTAPPQEQMQFNKMITYTYSFADIDGKLFENQMGYLGSSDMMDAMMGLFSSNTPGASTDTSSINLTLSLREVGGNAVSNDIKIYPKNLDMKTLVLEYLDKWNDPNAVITVNDKNLALKVDENDVAEGFEPRTEIKYTDTLSLIMSMITSMVDIVTIALISFTSLALVVSCVMISIITYVSVVERVKEIGVIRSLGGRKKDVSNLFNAETLVIGTASGLIGVGFTYLMSFIVNIFVKAAIGFPIMTLKLPSALIMLGLSIGLTVLSGLIPAKKASRQDPVVALRSE